MFTFKNDTTFHYSIGVKKMCEEKNTQKKQMIIESWERCKKIDLCPNIKSFKNEKIETNRSDKEILETILYFRDHIKDILLELYEVLNRKDGIAFILDRKFKIYQQKGNQKQLDYFNSLKLGIDSNFIESTVGTTSITLTSLTKKPEILIGSEHYLNIFHPFVTYSHYNATIDSYMLLIIPRNKFDDELLTILNLYLNSRYKTYKLYETDLELYTKNKFLEFSIENRDKNILYLNSDGQILNANHRFISLFGYEKNNIENKHYLDIFPELTPLEICFKQKQPVSIQQLNFKSLNNNKTPMTVEAVPLIEKNEVMGLSIFINNIPERDTKIKNKSCLKAKYTFQQILGTSSKLTEVKKLAQKSAKYDSSVIITGGSGTGKELFAQAIHNESLRAEGPFVSINCAALPKELIISELFGYSDGAFTGAKRGGSIGKIEIANTGTLFLDEIGELPLSAQAILLRILEEREITRIGSNQVIPIDIRLIAATNRNLEQLVSEGKFRLDLYYRLNVLELELPSLKERIEDIPLLATNFLQTYNGKMQKKISSISTNATKALQCYSWPGNIRELRNVIERAVTISESVEISLEDLPDKIAEELNSTEVVNATSDNGYYKDIEKENILKLMIKFNGNKSKIASSLGISRGTLYKKLTEYSII